MMRPFEGGSAGRTLIVLCVLAIVGAPVPASAQSTDVPQPNSPSIAKIGWYPSPMQRDYDFIFTATLGADVQPSSLQLEYCRIEDFSCAAPLPIEGTPQTNYAAVIKWNSTFWPSDARWVGFKVRLMDENGSVETSPTRHWPQAPAAVPAGAGPFYFVELVASEARPSVRSDAPALGVNGAVLACLVALLGAGVLHRRGA